MLLNRRTVLATVLSLGSFGIPGCASNSDDEMKDGMYEINFWLKEVTLSESKRDEIDPIVCSNVTDEEQEIIQTAIKDEYTSEIGSESRALESLREQIGNRTGSGVEAYIKCEDTYYRVGFGNGDHVIAYPDN